MSPDRSTRQSGQAQAEGGAHRGGPADHAAAVQGDMVSVLAPLNILAASSADASDAAREMLGFLDQGEVLCLAGLDEAGAVASDTALLLLYRSGRDALALAMSDGDAPGAALDRWISDAETALAIVRERSRRRVLLVDAGLLHHDPAALRDLLRRSFSCRFLNDAPGPSPMPAQSPIFAQMATETFRNSALARRMQARLEARADLRMATAAPNEGEGGDLLRDAFDAFVALRRAKVEVDATIETLEARLEDATAEASRLGKLNESLIEEANASARASELERAEEAAKRAALVANHENAEAALHADLAEAREAAAQDDRARAETERQLHDQLDWAHGEMKQLLASVSSLERSVQDAERKAAEDAAALSEKDEVLGHARADLEKRSAQIDAMLASTSWRITAPLRLLALSMRRK